ncbi:MAG: UDP-N-acetylmuramoyl-tripeptide--D-alanyl-D-alanine ligase, partial [Phycisphaerales bacterium]|nr:UDP-N-acetylmuramoyl-tripeptide--D-alanyl-D-alanine ligase [Phycisphaerales bacterium]
MHPIPLFDLRAAVGGIHLTDPTTGTLVDAPAVEAVCTDTRHMSPRSVFVALRGERFDAHDHLAAARAGGAIAAVVERVPAGFVPPPPGFHLIRVANTYAALGAAARFVRQRLHGKVIAVAGSNGKTGTKLLVHAALGTRLRGTVSPKSYNNNVGVPLAIFPADPADDYLVLELGTNHPGEIAPLTEMARPDVAVITNAGAEHLEGLGDLAGVRRENAAVTGGLSAGGLLVVNGDDPDLVAACAAAGWAGDRVTFGFGPHNDFFAADVAAGADCVRFMVCDKATGGRTPAFVPL